jgi:hypothetical protein
MANQIAELEHCLHEEKIFHSRKAKLMCKFFQQARGALEGMPQNDKNVAALGSLLTFYETIHNVQRQTNFGDG